MIGQDLCIEFPFTSRFFSLKPHLQLEKEATSRDFFLHYCDEGPRKNSAVVFLHGNPTWSFYFRKPLLHFSHTHRVIALDHLGSGLSEKPENYPLTLANHIAHLGHFLDALKIEKVTLVLHDWGGAIGMGWAVANPERVEKIVLMNTAAFTSPDIPKRIAFLKYSPFKSFFIRRLNLFALAATRMASVQKLSSIAKKGLLFPYNSYKNRLGILRFVEDIPMQEKHPSYATLALIEKALQTLSCPKLLLWGEKDFCFHMGFLNTWKKIYPDANIVSYPEAGHYVLEDVPKKCIDQMEKFL